MQVDVGRGVLWAEPAFVQIRQIIMAIEKGYFEVDALTGEQIASQCSRNGGRVFRLSEQSYSKDGFFNAVRRSLPLDPPLQSNRSWDALADSLWSGLDSLRETTVVILWLNSVQLQQQPPEDFSIALSILMDLPNSLASAAITAGPTKRLSILRIN